MNFECFLTLATKLETKLVYMIFVLLLFETKLLWPYLINIVAWHTIILFYFISFVLASIL